MFAFFQQRFKEKKKKKSCLVVPIPHYVKGQGLPRDYLGAFSGGDNLQISARSLLPFILEVVTASYFENCLWVIFRAVRVRSRQRKNEGKCGFKEQPGFSKHPILRFLKILLPGIPVWELSSRKADHRFLLEGPDDTCRGFSVT